MENKENQMILECLPKLPTDIRGLDKVLYGGVDVNLLKKEEQLAIVIRGNEDDNDKSMLAMQMLYGLAQSIERVKTKYPFFSQNCNNEPAIYSTYYQENKLKDLFLDFFISSSFQEILRNL